MVETLNRAQGELLTEREVLEGLGKEGLVSFVLDKGEEVGRLERLMSLAADVLEGLGTSIEEELKKREARNETKT